MPTFPTLSLVAAAVVAGSLLEDMTDRRAVVAVVA
jgi:hypothetical protein